ncbi:alpha/beta fold hydrolase [Butyrivibrio fibrisolvens]|uniref:alpha/beta fold hydrolase n=1 Tax=Butyrivibrio fibrisolvens TaxID=831 RepID=UPI0018AD32ED|nr:alpha/beta hydrolase [Butyrivibrio fibrisolvens]
MSFGFSYIGLLWVIMLMVPNLIWTKNQPKDYEKYVVNENKVLLALERAGEFIVTPIALIFSDFNFKGFHFWSIVLLISFLCMVLYEIYWIRYFKSSKTMKDFYSGILGIPVAGATLPVISFFLLGIYGGNILMIIGTIILGIGHIGIHLAHRKEVYGLKKKRKLPLRILFGIIKTVCVLVLVVVFGAFIFFIGWRNLKQLSHAIRYKDGVNDQIYVKLNDQEEYISIIGESCDNPVIISLHGGPGAPTTFIDYCWQDYLTDEYTVISWDERGCGRSYYRNIASDPDNETLTFEQQLSDLDALVDYACDRFGKDQVIILGHSYGTMLGSRYALAHPDKVSAYIGVGQCVNEQSYYGETYSYEDALQIAKEKGDDTSQMEEAYAKFLADMSIENLLQLRSLVSKYHPQPVTEDISTLAALSSPIAGVDDIRWYMIQMGASMGGTRYGELVEKPLGDYMMSFNILGSNDSYDMPVLLLSGSCDWVCPVGLVEDYADSISAPKVEVSLMEGCGHSPQGQLPEEFAQIIKDFLNTLK